MKTSFVARRVVLLLTAALFAFVLQSKALDSLTNGVVAYWPMDEISGSVLTPDLGPNSFDLKPHNNKVPVAFNGANITLSVHGGPHANVNGRQNGTNALVTSIAQSTTLGYIAPVTSATQLPGLTLPPLNLPNWTLSFWVKAANGGGNTGNRMFAITDTPLGNAPNLLWDITQSNQSDQQIGHFRRQAGSIINGIQFLDDNGSGDQINTVGQTLWDNNWHNITIIATTITNTFPPIIDVTQFGNPVNGSVTIIFTNSMPLDNNASNALAQVDTNQFFRILISTNLNGPWAVRANNGNGSSFTDATLTNDLAFYRVQKPLIREQVRYLYVDGVKVPITPGDSIEDYLGTGAWQSKPAKTGATFRLNGYFFCDTIMFGGFVRAAGEGGFVNAAFSDAAVWSRALSQAELNAFIQDGITNASVFQAPLFALLSAEYPAAAQGDTVHLTWSASKPPATLTLAPGYGDVTGISNLGIGSSNAVVNSNTVFTLTATRGPDSTNASVSVICVSNVAANWHYIDSFTYLSDGPIAGQGNWANPPRGPATATGAQPFEVHTANDGNKLASFDGFWVDPLGANTTGNGGIAGRGLGTFSSTVGKTNTLFFRFYIDPAATNIDNQFGTGFNLIDFSVGLQDLGIADPAFLYGGPQIRIFQANTLGGAVDLQANSGNANILVAPALYSYVTDTNTGDTNGLAVGMVYNVWIDVVNNFPGVAGGFASGGEQTNACLYAVWLQREDWPSRTNLFSSITCTNTGGLTMNGVVYPTGYMLSPRNYAINSQENILLGPSSTLGYTAIYMRQATSPQITNGVRFDDFFISKSGANSTIPVTAGSFVTP